MLCPATLRLELFVSLFESLSLQSILVEISSSFTSFVEGLTMNDTFCYYAWSKLEEFLSHDYFTNIKFCLVDRDGWIVRYA